MSLISAKLSLARTVAIVLLSLHVAPNLRRVPYHPAHHHQTIASPAAGVASAAAASLELVLSSDVTEDGVRLEEEESKPIRFNYTLKVSGDSNHTLALAVCATVDDPDIAVATVSPEAIVPLHADLSGAFDVTVRGLFLGRAFLHVHFVVGHGGVRCGQPEAEGLQELLRVSENGKNREMAWNVTRTSPHPRTSSSSSSSSLSSSSSSSQSSSFLSTPAPSTSRVRTDKPPLASSPFPLSPSSSSSSFRPQSSSNSSSDLFSLSTANSSSSSSSLSTSSPPSLSSSRASSFSSSPSSFDRSSSSPSSSSSSYLTPASSSSSSFHHSSSSSTSSPSSPTSSSSSSFSSSSPSSNSSLSPSSSFSSRSPTPSISVSSSFNSSSSSSSSSPPLSASLSSSSSSPSRVSSSSPAASTSSSSSSVLGVHSGRRYPVVVVRKETALDVLFKVVTVVLVIVINVGMGSELDIGVVKATLRRPFAPITGVVSQFAIMPVVAFGVTQAFKLESGVALGFFALGCSPGGSLSNSFCYLLGGDVSLSITMTFISTVAAMGMVPLWLYTLGRYVSEERNIKVPFENIVLSLLGLVLAVGFGLLLKVKKPRWAKISVIISKVFLGILLVFMMTVGVYTNLYIFSLMSPHVLAGAALLPYTGFLLGGLVAIVLRFPRKHVVTIAVETGIQNTGIAIILMLLSLDHPDSDLSIVGPVASSIFTPLPLWIAVAAVKLRQRFCKKKHTAGTTADNNPGDDDDEASRAEGHSRRNNNSSSATTTPPAVSSSTTTATNATSLWKKLFGKKGDGNARGGGGGGGTEATGSCLCGRFCGLKEVCANDDDDDDVNNDDDDDLENGGRRRTKKEEKTAAGQADVLAMQNARSNSSTGRRPPSSSLSAAKHGSSRTEDRSGSNGSGSEGGYDNLALDCDQVNCAVMAAIPNPGSAPRRPEFTGGGGMKEEKGDDDDYDERGYPSAMTPSESLYDVISVNSEMSAATVTTTASTVRSEKKQFSKKFSKQSSSSSYSSRSRSPRSEDGEGKWADNNEDESNI